MKIFSVRRQFPSYAFKRIQNTSYRCVVHCCLVVVSSIFFCGESLAESKAIEVGLETMQAQSLLVQDTVSPSNNVQEQATVNVNATLIKHPPVVKEIEEEPAIEKIHPRSLSLPVTNTIRSIQSLVQGSETYIRITLDHALKIEPQVFSTAAPPRLLLDFFAAKNGMKVREVSFTDGIVSKAYIVSNKEKLRISLKLDKIKSHKITLDGNILTVIFGNDSDSPDKIDKADSAPSEGNHRVEDIDFHRGAQGQGRLLINLSDASTTANVRKEGNKLFLDFLDTNLSENTKKRFDVSDFGTPVKSIFAKYSDKKAQIIINSEGEWEYQVYQSGQQLITEVIALKEDPHALVQGSGTGYKGDRLSLNFQNVEIRSILQVIADFTGLNMVVSDAISGSISLHLQEVPWDQALDIILQSKGLDKRKNGNVIMVAPSEEFSKKEKQELETKRQILEISPLVTETFQLNYQRGALLVKLLSDEKRRVLSNRGSVVVDDRTNKIFVQDTAERLEDIRSVIAQVDIPVRQVLIEARIVEASDDFTRNIGAKLGYNDRRSTIYKTLQVKDPTTGTVSSFNVPVYGAGQNLGGDLYASVASNLQGVLDASSQTSKFSPDKALGLAQESNLANTNFVSLPASGAGGFGPASIGLSLFGASLTRFLNLEISALEADNQGKIISSPRVLTADQTKALIEQGTEIPYQSASASGATAVEFKKAVMKLEVTPQITPEGAVILAVDVARDSVGVAQAGGVPINTRHVQTQVLVEDGGTVVIGGIYEQTETHGETRVPFLGDIPLIGLLFRTSSKLQSRKELLVFLTPRVVTDSTSIS